MTKELKMPFRKFTCEVCGHVYDEAVGPERSHDRTEDGQSPDLFGDQLVWKPSGRFARS